MGGGTGGDRAALLLPALLGQRWGRACKYPSLMRGVCAPAADLGVLFFPATGGETHAMAPGRLHRDKPLRQAPRLASGGGTAAIAALCMVVPPHLGSSCLQHPPHLGSSCPRCRGDPRNCSSHLSLKSQEGDAQQMLVGAFPATQHWETPPHPPPPLQLVPKQGSLPERRVISSAPRRAFAVMHLFSVKGRGTTNNRKSKCTQEKGPKTVWWLTVMPAAGPPSGSMPD